MLPEGSLTFHSTSAIAVAAGLHVAPGPGLPSRSCQVEGGKDDLRKGTQLLEIYALEIQIYTEQKNNKKLKVRSMHAADLLSAHSCRNTTST